MLALLYIGGRWLEARERQPETRGDYQQRYIYEETIEVGGQAKGFEQIAGVDNSYIFADDIEMPYGRKLPLWLAGFTY